MLSILLLVLAAQSLAPQSPVCAKALASAFGAAASEICLAEEEARRLEPVFRLARLQEDRGWIDVAESTLVEARRQHPDDVEPYKALAQFYARRVSAMTVETAQATPPSPPAQRDEKGVVRIGGSMAPPRRVGNPVYPPEAKAAGIEGVVIAEIVVDEQGSVTEAKVIRSL